MWGPEKKYLRAFVDVNGQSIFSEFFGVKCGCLNNSCLPSTHCYLFLFLTVCECGWCPWLHHRCRSSRWLPTVQLCCFRVLYGYQNACVNILPVATGIGSTFVNFLFVFRVRLFFSLVSDVAGLCCLLLRQIRMNLRMFFGISRAVAFVPLMGNYSRKRTNARVTAGRDKPQWQRQQ